MRGRIKSKTKDRYQEAIRDVVKCLGRDVQIFLHPIKSACNNCGYDKLTDSSTNKCSWTAQEALQKQQDWVAAGNATIRYKYFLKGRCPVCMGKGYLETQRKVWSDCLITWNPSMANNALTYTPAGVEGSTLCQLKTHPKYYDNFKNSTRIIVDGIECKLSTPPILVGLGNQALLIVTVFTTEKPKIDSDEIIKDYS
jgi:hypothetical protein